MEKTMSMYKIMRVGLLAGLVLGILSEAKAQSTVVAVGQQTTAVTALSTTAATVVSNLSAGVLRYRVIVQNLDIVTASGGTGLAVWCRWGATAVVRGTESFLLLPGTSMNVTGAGVSQSTLSCIAESGTPSIYVESYTS